MKRGLSAVLATLILMLIALASLAETSDANASQATNAMRLMGTITAVDESAGTLTVSRMLMQNTEALGAGQPDGNGAQNAPSGSAPQQGANGQGGGQGTAPSGNPPQQNGGSSGSAPDGNGQNGNGQGGAPDGQTPNATDYTVSVTASTTITSQETQSALTLADLAVGTRVEITLTGDETNGYAATAIQTQPDAQPAATDTASN